MFHIYNPFGERLLWLGRSVPENGFPTIQEASELVLSSQAREGFHIIGVSVDSPTALIFKGERYDHSAIVSAGEQLAAVLSEYFGQFDKDEMIDLFGEETAAVIDLAHLITGRANQEPKTVADVIDEEWVEYTERAAGASVNAQIRDLGNEEYRLREPLAITVEEYPSDGGVIASYPELELFAEGVTKAEAITALKREILDLYDELMEESTETLGKGPLAWRRILESLVIKEAVGI